MDHINELFARAKALCDTQREIGVQLTMLYRQIIDTTIVREKASSK